MNEQVTVIDIVAQVTDDTASGSKSAQDNVSKLEKSLMNLQKQITGMKGKSKLEVAATLKDMASKGIQGIANAGKKIAGKVWTVTLKAVDLVSAPFKKVWGLVSNPITQAATFAGISLGVADTISTFKDFEQGMANVKAISGATGKDFDDLTATAKKLGETTQFSAAQAAEAMENLAMAGWKSGDIIAGMPGLLDLAAAGSVDLATASDVTASALAQFGLKADEASRVADILAATATNSKTDITGLGESLKYAGPLAGSLGYSLEDVSVALGVMGNNAIDASSAGTALRGMLARMSKQEGLTAEESNAVAEAMKKVGVSMTDEKGKSKSLLTVMQELRKGFSGMTESEKAATAANLAGQNAMSGLLAIVNSSDEDFNKLEQAIKNSSGAAAEMAGIKMDTLQGSLFYLQSAAEGVKIALGEKLGPYVRKLVDWVTAHMPQIQEAVGGVVDFITGKIDDVIASVEELTASPEWKNAGSLWEKIKLAWDKIIVEPFSEWWNGTGKAWLAGIAESVGAGLGTALHDGIMGLLGIDVGGVTADGVSIGKSFASAFAEGFNGKEVGEAIVQAIKEGLKSLAKDAMTLLPGGKEASGTSGLSAAVLGYGGLKAAKGASKLYRGGKAIYNGVKAVGNVTGISEGMRIFGAAKSGGSAAQSALSFAQNGALGHGVKFGTQLASGASKVGQFATKAMPIAAGVGSLIAMGADAKKGVGMAQEWTGSDSTGAKVASGVGAALGGTGNGILGDESAGKKALDIGGGALKGAGLGAAIGSIIPGIGTAIGGAVGAGVGALGAAIGGSNIAKALSTAGGAIKGFFTETVPEKFGQVVEGAKGFFTESVPNAINSAKEKVTGFFTETIPQKFDELREGITSFFTESVPYAIGYAAGKIQVFFTETVPEKFNELVTGITTFFTETVPNAIATAGAAVGNFFTVTVPEFFGNLWDGVTGFFTETVPAALTTVGEALTTFFTETVPQFFSDVWEGITGFFTETVPQALETVGGALKTFFTESIPGFFSDLWDGIVDFFTESVPNAIATAGAAVGNFFTVTVPEFFGNLWDGVTGFFTETVPAALTTVGEALTTFFTETVPEFFNGIWEGITGFFTETIPTTLETVGDALSTFFTETVPGFFQNLWDGIVGFFTESIPNAIKSVGESISGFFSSVKEKISGFFGGLWDKVTGSASAGYEAATAKHAEGGIMTRPHMGLVAEDGAEAIIPLSGKRRERGIDLWEKTGKMLGVKPYAEGGIAGTGDTDSGNPDDNAPAPDWKPQPPPPPEWGPDPTGTGGGVAGSAEGGMTVPVTIQSLTFEVHVDGSGTPDTQTLVETIKENVRSMTDEIAYQLAVAMQQAFANTPRASWEG